MKTIRRIFSVVLVAGWAGSACFGQGAAASAPAKPRSEQAEALLARCAACHLTDAGGPVSGDTPAIAGQHRRVLLRELSDFRFGKRWVTSMRRVTDPHTMALQDLTDAAQFVSEAPWRTTQIRGDGNELARGAEVYALRCVSCHGQAGTGSDEAAVPRLAGQSYRYLLRQMYDAVDGQRTNLTKNHLDLLKSLKRADFPGIADYLSRMDAEPVR